MKAYPDCVPCLFKQALNTVKSVTSDPTVQETVVRELARHLPERSLDDTPAGFSQLAYDVVHRLTGESDPYREKKEQTNREALELLPELQDMMHRSEDTLKAAVRIAVAGNVVDLGIGHDFDIERDIYELLERPLAIDDTEAFRKEITPEKNLLYVGDNSGEIVFDRILVEQLLSHKINVTFVVKSKPIINDATMRDAELVGLTAIVPVIETGSGDIGVNWKRCSREFLEAFMSADIVVSKGQGNFETLSEGHRTEKNGSIFYLLKAKCECVAKELDVRFGDIVVKRSRGD